ncbi:hypothetical protein INT47_007542 [Mucor saturninus]|uniref:Kelch repeat protein n=1 Tax=Mucor saturninus TaxID=64648 RepID=A0A8H7R3U2_9FUNG|nr:hypothetical protein INT47_007542 [Mucor saturninus]
MLDISNTSETTADELMNKWVTVTTNTNGLDIKGRNGIATVPLPDGKTMLLLGGGVSGTTKLPNQMIAFNGETKAWQAYPDYTEDPYGVRQIYYTAASYVPEYGVAFYGGLETNYDKNYILPDANISYYQNDAINVRFFGFRSLTFLDIRKSTDQILQPWSVYPTQNNNPGILARYQKSVYDPTNKRLFYFGGRYQAPPSTPFGQFAFNNVTSFDLTRGEWGVQVLNGIAPTERNGHTVTLIGPKQRDVLLYGGNSNLSPKPLLDYCFTLNLDNFQWTQQSIEAKSNPTLMRSEHSTVVINYETVFVLFGIDSTEKPILSLLTLNVSDPLNITWIEKYSDPNIAAVVLPNSNSTSVDEPKASVNPKPLDEPKPITNSKLSAGAIAGITVGVAAGIIGIAIIFFCFIRKRKPKTKGQETKEVENPQREDQVKEPVMEVNWDDIEKKYVEIPDDPSAKKNYLSSQTDLVVESVALVPNTNNGRLSEKFQRPQAVEVNKVTGIRVGLSAQKPDGNA